MLPIRILPKSTTPRSKYKIVIATCDLESCDGVHSIATFTDIVHQPKPPSITKTRKQIVLVPVWSVSWCWVGKLLLTVYLTRWYHHCKQQPLKIIWTFYSQSTTLSLQSLYRAYLYLWEINLYLFNGSTRCASYSKAVMPYCWPEDGNKDDKRIRNKADPAKPLTTKVK